jgi:hypothetical protein
MDLTLTIIHYISKDTNMRELSLGECLKISGGEDDTFDLNDVFAMIEKGDAKLLLVGTLVAFGTGYLTASIVMSRAGLGYGMIAGVFGIVAGAYIVPAAAILTYKMVEHSYHMFGLVH